MNAWIFDADGVISNIATPEKINKEVLAKIIDLLEKKEIVAIISGRSITWQKTHILSSILTLIKQRHLAFDLLDYFVLSG